MIRFGTRVALIAVSLLVRLRVEISNVYVFQESSPVSLLVRLRVEITSCQCTFSSSSVSLLVRLRVEILLAHQGQFQELSASSWGCELKFTGILLKVYFWRQPPREAASWNNTLDVNVAILLRQPPREAASWNAYDTGEKVEDLVSLLVRLRVEMKSWWMSQSLSQSASSWGCELKCIIKNDRKWSNTVSLLVRLRVEILTPGTSVQACTVSLLVRLRVEISIFC